MRPQRVWLVWTRFDGEERGDGKETIFARVEILPTPRVADMTAITYKSAAAGTYQDGTIRVDQISSALFSEDELCGVKVPMRGFGGLPAPPPAGCKGPEFDIEYADNVSFGYWVQEDGRGDDPGRIRRFALQGVPWRDASTLAWTVILHRADRDPHRDGHPINVGMDRDLRRLLEP